MRLPVLLLVVGLVLGSCAFGESELAGRLSCWDLVAGDEFGGGRDIPEADIKLFTRAGAWEAADVAAILEPLGVPTDADHVARVTGPCGEQDIFVRFADGEQCVTVVALRWWDHVCRDAVDGPTDIPLDMGEVQGHALLLVDGGDIATVLAESGGLVLGAIPIGGHTVLSSPEPITNPIRIPFSDDTSP
jgi:hypothetical protein